MCYVCARARPRAKIFRRVGTSNHLKVARKFNVALNPMYRIFLNFAKSCILSCLSKFYNKKKFPMPFFKYKCLKLKLRVFLAVIVLGVSAMVTYCVAKIIPTCSPVIGQFFDTMIVA